MIDLSKIAPAPWHNDGREIYGPSGSPANGIYIYDEGGHNEDEAQFICLARNAFDVMMRRGWTLEQIGTTWFVADGCDGATEAANAVGGFQDPFTALVEADKWYREHVEAEKSK